MTAIRAGKSHDHAMIDDRRRPGRIERPHPHLLPLLRQQPPGRATEAPNDLGVASYSAEPWDDDAASPGHGIVIAGIVGIATWGAVGTAIWLLVRSLAG